MIRLSSPGPTIVTPWIFISGIKVLGQLDAPNAVLLAQGKTEKDFNLNLTIPQIGESAFSVQALALYTDGSYAISPVLTVLVTARPDEDKDDDTAHDADKTSDADADSEK